MKDEILEIIKECGMGVKDLSPSHIPHGFAEYKIRDHIEKKSYRVAEYKFTSIDHLKSSIKETYDKLYYHGSSIDEETGEIVVTGILLKELFKDDIKRYNDMNPIVYGVIRDHNEKIRKKVEEKMVKFSPEDSISDVFKKLENL